MNETTTSTANDAVFSEWMSSDPIPELRPYSVMRGLMRHQGPEHSNVFSWTLLDDPGVAVAKAEGSSLSNTSFTTAKVQATAGTVGMMATLTEELTRISLFDAYAVFGAQIWRSVAEKFETDATALLDDATNITGTSGVDYSWAQRAEAVTALANREITGPLVEVIHTQQHGDLVQDTLGSSASIWARDSLSINDHAVTDLQGYQGVAFNVATFTTQLVPTANSGADRFGAIFDASTALGHYEIWAAMTETDRDISLPGTEVVTTERYGVGVISNTRMQGVRTDA